MLYHSIFSPLIAAVFQMSPQGNRATSFCSQSHQNQAAYDLYQHNYLHFFCSSLRERKAGTEWNRRAELLGRGSKAEPEVYLWL